MSTNYYLDEPHNEAGHLGKFYATGFIAKAAKGIDTHDQWVAQMQGHRIFAEHGMEISASELVEMAEEHGRAHSLRYRALRGQGTSSSAASPSRGATSSSQTPQPRPTDSTG